MSEDIIKIAKESLENLLNLINTSEKIGQYINDKEFNRN